MSILERLQAEALCTQNLAECSLFNFQLLVEVYSSIFVNEKSGICRHLG